MELNRKAELITEKIILKQRVKSLERQLKKYKADSLKRKERRKMLEIPEGYIRKRSSTIPFGYEVDENYTGYLRPIPNELEALNEVTRAVSRNEISLGVGVDWLEAETNRTVSRMGLKKIVDKNYKKTKSILDKS